MDAVNATRARMNALLEKEKNGKKISVNDFVVKASAAALRAVPEVNSSWMDTHVRQYKLADVCVAVQTDKGLMVPVVRSACCLGLRDISSEVKSLVEKAKMGKLQGKDVPAARLPFPTSACLASSTSRLSSTHRKLAF